MTPDRPVQHSQHKELGDAVPIKGHPSLLSPLLSPRQISASCTMIPELGPSLPERLERIPIAAFPRLQECLVIVTVSPDQRRGGPPDQPSGAQEGRHRRGPVPALERRLELVRVARREVDHEKAEGQQTREEDHPDLPVRHVQSGDAPAPSPRCRGGKHAAPMCRQDDETTVS
jgi:hypothetical protein